jgi:hypothetical protein
MLLLLFYEGTCEKRGIDHFQSKKQSIPYSKYNSKIPTLPPQGHEAIHFEIYYPLLGRQHGS